MNFLKPEISNEDHIQQAIHTLFWDERKNPPRPGSPRAIGRILEWGQWCQVMAVENTFSPEELAHALENTPYGTVTEPTFNYWQKRLGIPITRPTRFSKKSWH
jgi:hypothetical protein